MTEEKQAKEDTPKCDVCGDVAVNFAIDVAQEIPSTSDGAKIFRPMGEKKFGCAKHPAESVKYDYMGNIDE